MRKRAEELLIEGHRDRQVVTLLERLAQEAEDCSETALFAHRQLAELRLEESPWRAALHLRRLTEAGVNDYGVFALLGLCHALMGNFRTAVSSYRRALRTAANNPWYHHNLGHLLDVGLGDPRSALFHLREAHRLEPEEDEVTASLAHCLARLGSLDEAQVLARRAVGRAAENVEHQALLEWIESGAEGNADVVPRRARVRPGGSTPPPKKSSSKGGAAARKKRAAQQAEVAEVTATVTAPLSAAVEELLEVHMHDGGFSVADMVGAVALWADYRKYGEVGNAKPAVLAATIEYAYAKLMHRRATQSALAQRYGVGSGSISARYRHMMEVLNLVPFDPRYVARNHQP